MGAQARGISGVRVEQTDGYLTDHYDPSDKVLRLGPNVFHESTVTAAGIAAHEVGHALQDQEGYAPMRLRQIRCLVTGQASTRRPRTRPLR
jgi:hypothetical protein